MAALLAGPLVAAVALLSGGDAPPIRIVGSDTLLILNRELAAEYARRAPSMVVDVAGGGSEIGIQALMAGKTDVAAASRAMKESERAEFEKRNGRRPEEIVVALDGLAIYVHQANPIGTLTVAQVARIMTGEYRNWRDVGGLDLPIDVLTRDQNSGTRGFLQDHVLGRDEPFSPRAREVATTEEMTQKVSCDPGAIGYGGIAYSRGARILKLALHPAESGVFPTQESVGSGDYPLARALYYYVDPAAKRPELRAFLAWVAGAEGGRVIEKVGYFGRPAAADPAAPATTPAATSAATASGATLATRAPPSTDVALTPKNMVEHGFELAVVARESIVPGARRVAVTVRFGAAGRAVDRLRRVVLVVGDVAEVPIDLASDRTLQFDLEKGLLAKSSLRLLAGDGSVFTAAIGAFCTGE